MSKVGFVVVGCVHLVSRWTLRLICPNFPYFSGPYKKTIMGWLVGGSPEGFFFSWDSKFRSDLQVVLTDETQRLNTYDIQR